MNILQVTMLGNVGGAAKVAWELRKAYAEYGHRSLLAVGYPSVQEVSEDIYTIPNDHFRNRWSRALYAIPTFMRNHRIRGSQLIRRLLIPFAQPHRAMNRWRGLEDFDYPASNDLIHLSPERPDVINCHNLHSEYFDLRALAELSHQVPVILTLHDMWLITGHCAYAVDCDRWQLGCGLCPDLKRYPAINRDASNQNWHNKKSIYAASRLYVISLCNWIMNTVDASMLEPAGYKVIPNGIDLSVFRPTERSIARQQLGLPIDAFIVLFVGVRAQNNSYKDFTTVRRAANLIASRSLEKNVVFVSLGGNADRIVIEEGLQTHYYKYRSLPQDVARFYQAADIFLHAANTDTSPATVIESLACGTPVVATAVGGIPEQIDDGVTGFLTPRGDPEAMANRCMELIHDEALLRSFSQNAVWQARKRFDFQRQVTDYLQFYEEVIEDHRRWRNGQQGQ